MEKNISKAKKKFFENLKAAQVLNNYLPSENALLLKELHIQYIIRSLKNLPASYLVFKFF